MADARKAVTVLRELAEAKRGSDEAQVALTTVFGRVAAETQGADVATVRRRQHEALDEVSIRVDAAARRLDEAWEKARALLEGTENA